MLIRLQLALEGRFMGAIEDEQRLYIERQQSQKSVVKRSQRRIAAPFARLNLKMPY